MAHRKRGKNGVPEGQAKSHLAGLILLMLIIGGGIGFPWVHGKFSLSGAASVGLPLPDVYFETLTGNRVHFGRFQGNSLLVVFLDLECGFCLNQLNELKVTLLKCREWTGDCSHTPGE